MFDRVMVFIDGSNFYHGKRDVLGNVGIDYRCLVKKLVGERRLVRVYYYIPMINKDEAQEQYRSQLRFVTYLQEIPYFHVKYGRLMRQGDVLVEKSIDVQIAVDMVRYAAADYFDVAILVSGDGDFSPAVEAVKEMGKQVEVAFFQKETAQQLRQVSDLFIDLCHELIGECLFQKGEDGSISEGL